MKSPYSSLPINKRIERAMQDTSFEAFCKRERQSPDFDEKLAIIEKIAKIDISNITCDYSLTDSIHVFTPKEIMVDTIDFYDMIDGLAPQGIDLGARLYENSQYFTKDLNGKNGRAYCKSGKLKDGTPFREIFVEINGRIDDTITSIHEFGHSFCEPFMQIIKPKDRKTEEISTVITDNLASIFLKKQHPDYCENYIESDRIRQIINIKKARECLMDAMIVKVMCGEDTFDNVMKTYGDYVTKFPDRMSQMDAEKAKVQQEKQAAESDITL